MHYNCKKIPMFWVLERKAIEDEYRCQLSSYSETDPSDYTTDDHIVYYGVELPRHPKIENETLREATDEELVEKGVYSLSDGEFIHEGKAKTKWGFECPSGLIKPEFNYETFAWEETATPEELKEASWNAEVSFYNSELEFASKATAELACEIITEEMFEDVKLYMKAIDPYATKKKRMKKVGRPPVFDRYN